MKERVLLLSMWYPSHQEDRQRTWAIADIVAEMRRRFSVSTVVVVAREENRGVSTSTVNGQLVISVPVCLIIRLRFGWKKGRGEGTDSNIPIQRVPLAGSAAGEEQPGAGVAALPLWKVGLRWARNRLIRLSRRMNSGISKVLDQFKRPFHYRQLREVLEPLGPFDRVIIHGRIARHMELVQRFWPGPVSVCFHETDFHEPTREEVFRNWGSRIRQVAFRSEQLHEKFVQAGLIDPSIPYFAVASGVPERMVRAREDYKQREPGILKLVCVSSMIRRKNLGSLIQTLAGIRSFAWSLDLYGRGPLQGELEELVAELGLQEKVRFQGFVPHEEIMRRYSSYDVFVLLSERETFGMVYTEALSQGLFVIGSDEEGIDGIIQDGDNGFLVPPKRPEMLLEKLESINNLDGGTESIFKNRIYESTCALTLERIAGEYYKRMVRLEGGAAD